MSFAFHIRDKNGVELIYDDTILQNCPIISVCSEEILILETGRMGEPIKSLQKMANGTHRTIHVKDGDLAYIATTPTIAMETVMAKTEDIIYII